MAVMQRVRAALGAPATALTVALAGCGGSHQQEPLPAYDDQPDLTCAQIAKIRADEARGNVDAEKPGVFGRLTGDKTQSPPAWYPDQQGEAARAKCEGTRQQLLKEQREREAAAAAASAPASAASAAGTYRNDKSWRQKMQPTRVGNPDVETFKELVR